MSGNHSKWRDVCGPSIEIGARWLRAVAQGSTLLSVMMIALVWRRLSSEGQIQRAERAAVQIPRSGAPSKTSFPSLVRSTNR